MPAEPPRPLAPPDGRAPSGIALSPRSAALYSVVLVAFLVVSTVSSLEHTPVGALHGLTGPIERLLGINQSWSMFAPNPPSDSRWLRVTAEAPDGVEVPLAVLEPEASAPAFRWGYSRRSKFERNVVRDGKRNLRRGVASWHCAQARAQGIEAKRIHFYRAVQPTPSPEARASGTAGPRDQWPMTIERLGRVRCK